MDIEIDASLSRDEKFSNIKTSDPDLLFSWEGPIKMNNIMKKYKIPLNENKILIIKAEEYKKHIQNIDYINTSFNYEFDFKLILTKNGRTAMKNIKVAIKIKKENQEKIIINNNTNNKNETIIEEKSIIIQIDKITIKDLILKYSILDNSINIMRFRNTWTIKNFPENKYLNGRNEIKLKINKDDLLIGKNEISLKLFDKLTNDTFIEKFIYEKTKKPYGGNCEVFPPEGFSLFTNFTFTINNWKSSSFPLSYSLKYSNSENILIDITNGGFFTDQYTTNEIPVGYQIHLFITDIEGKYISIPCSPQVLINKNLPPIDEFINKIYDPLKKILLMDIYESNKIIINKQNDNNNNNNNKEIIIENKIEILNSILSISSEAQIIEEYNNIISQVIKITKMDQLSEKMIDQILNIFNLIIEYIDSFVEDLKKIDSLYLIINNLNTKLTKLKGKKINKFKFKLNLLDSTNFDNKKIKQITEILNKVLNIIIKKQENNIITGEKLIQFNDEFDNQINKISSYNTQEISFKTLEDTRRYKKNRMIRILSNNDNIGYEIFNVNKNKTNSIINKESNSEGLAFVAKYNKNNNLLIETNANRKIFSKSSFDFSFNPIYENQENEKRLLSNSKIEDSSNNNNLITYEIRLRIPEDEDALSMLENTVCARYTESGANKNDTDPTSCFSWYDKFKLEVVCMCNSPGLIINLFDKGLSKASKILQFPFLIDSLSKKIINFLIFLIYNSKFFFIGDCRTIVFFIFDFLFNCNCFG